MGASATGKAKTKSARKKAAGKSSADFEATFEALKNILKPYEKRCVVETNGPLGYCLYTKKPIYQGKPLYFAGANIKKNYVSFYLMSVYGSPKEQAKISPELRKRMQGKACFNFASPDAKLMKELSELVKSGSEKFLDVDVLDTSELKCD